MKQKLQHQSFIVTLVTMLLLLAGSSVSAQEEYGLAIAGVRVTSANCSDLTAIPGVTGNVSYDPTTKTLTLEDASIVGGEGRHSISSIDELTCVVKGEVSITSNDRNAMVFGKNAIIKGNGQLTIKSSEYGGIITEAALLIEGCTVYAEGKWGIAGRNGTYGESLAIRNASVTAKGTKGSICDLTNFTLEGCSITKPAGAVWNASKHAVCDASGNVITDEVVITPPVPVEEYGFEIAGVQVTSENCSDLSVIDGVTGKVSYDPTTKTLTLEDASIDGGEEFGIWSTDELTCVVKGKVSITSNWGAMAFLSDAIIKGNGQLTLKSSGECGIRNEATLLIEDCTVYAEGVWGIAGNDGSIGESLTIRNASVTAKGTEGSICDFANFTLEGCEITKPAGAVWNASKHAVCDASSNVIKDEVVITPPVPVEEYGLKIAGVGVNSENCSDLSVIDGVTGKVTYDPTTKTLTLEDASINGGEDRLGIWSKDELTCVVKGEVSITSNNSSEMVFDKNAIIKGNGQLTLKSSEQCGIYTEAALLIEGCTVYAEGKCGISGFDGSSGESLIIRNATVTAKGTKGSIRDLADFTLEGCEITKPAGAVWNASKHAVCDASGNVITDQVVITPTGGVTPPVEEYGLLIAGVGVTSANCSDLSVIDGVTGKVTYDPTTKTLTLEDASIDGGEAGIWSNDELTCVVKGEVSITSNGSWGAMAFDKNVIIKGNGQLTIKSSEKCGIITEAALLIEGCTVYAEGNWGISGSYGTIESLTIRNASVTAKGTEGSICDFTSFTLDGCSITKPAGAVWNASKHAVCDASGNVITDEVVITPPVEKYTVTFATEPAGQGTLTATGATDLTAVPYGTELTIVATPATGYELTALTANGTDILATKKFTVTADTEIKATFTKKTYAVTLTKEGEGTITATGAADLTAVPYGTELTIVATPATGYELTALTANGTDILATKKVIVKEAIEVKATFTKKSFAVSLTKEGEGTIIATGASNLNSVAYGTELTIVATPAAGYELVSLDANGVDITATKKVVVIGDLTVKATFTKKVQPKTYKVTLKPTEHGTITIKEDVDLNAVPEGTKLTVVPKGANDKCELTKLTANGEDILKDMTFTVTEDTEVVAEFVDHTGIDAVAANAFVIYPNPASESATVTGLAPEAAVALYTLDGQLITRLAADRSGRLQIDLTALSDGTYLVVTEGAAQRLVVKH